MNDLKKSIKKFLPCQCPRCGNTLGLITSEIDLSILSDNGIIEHTTVVEHKDIGYCSICELKLNMKRVGLYTIPDYDIRRELQIDEKTIENFENKVIFGTESDHPFGKES